MITLNQLKELFESAESLPDRPSFKDYPVYVITDAIDINQTVKWNREEVQRRMKAREQETERLREAKKHCIEESYRCAIAYIMQQTGLVQPKAEILWDFVVSNYQSRPQGAPDIWSHLEMQINLYNSLR